MSELLAKRLQSIDCKQAGIDMAKLGNAIGA